MISFLNIIVHLVILIFYVKVSPFSGFITAIYLLTLIILGLTKVELEAVLTTYDIKRLDLYSRNMADYHLITDLLPAGKELKCVADE